LALEEPIMYKYASLACLLISLAACHQSAPAPISSNDNPSSADATGTSPASNDLPTSGGENSTLPAIAQYPDLVQIPDFPVYYAPQLNSNYFFYDGSYWVYEEDNWYTSSWYNGPWDVVEPEDVPLFILRIPVGYYRQPPAYFQAWSSDAAPHWDEHYGDAWAQRRSGWNQWNRDAAPRVAPLPVYQRQYSQNNYPEAQQQAELQSQHYHYRPRNPAARKPSKENGRVPVESGASATHREINRTPMPAHSEASMPNRPLSASQSHPQSSQPVHRENALPPINRSVQNGEQFRPPHAVVPSAQSHRVAPAAPHPGPAPHPAPPTQKLSPTQKAAVPPAKHGDTNDKKDQEK